MSATFQSPPEVYTCAIWGSGCKKVQAVLVLVHAEACAAFDLHFVFAFSGRSAYPDHRSVDEHERSVEWIARCMNGCTAFANPLANQRLGRVDQAAELIIE
jgi:hypothetical protein